jgi:hypothetical protein
MEESLKDIVFDAKLSDAQRAAKMEIIADNAVRRIEEDKKLENESRDVFGIDLTSFNDDREKADSPWLSQTAIKRMINGYLSERLGKNNENLTDSELSLTADDKALMFEDYNRLDGKAVDKVWERYLKSSKINCQITLSSSEATKNKKNIFLTLLHPLVRQAASHYSGGSTLKVSLLINGQDIPKGKYPFSLYAWEYKGFRPHTEFVLVCEDGTITNELLNALPNMTMLNDSIEAFNTVLAAQEARHLSLWRKARAAFLAEVKSNCDYKIASIEKSLITLKARAEEQLASTSDAKIEVMRRAQIERLEADFEIKKARHSKSAESADLIATLLASGIIISQ